MFSKVILYKSATQKEQNILNHDYPQYLFSQHRGTEKQRCTMKKLLGETLKLGELCVDYPQYLFSQHRGTEKQRCTMEKLLGETL